MNAHGLIIDKYLKNLQSDNTKYNFNTAIRESIDIIHIDLDKFDKSFEKSFEEIKRCNNIAEALGNDYKPIAKDQIYAAKETIMLRRINVVGLKMKNYLEQLKAYNAVEILRKVKTANFKEFQGKNDFKKCIKLNKTIKKNIEKDSELYRQFHYRMDTVSSAVLSYITSIMYHNADLWEAMNILTMSNYLLLK